jgi:hypothetical protein
MLKRILGSGGLLSITRGDVHASPDDRVRYYEYKGGNHNAATDRGLTEPDLTEWFFSKSHARRKGGA